MPSEYWMNLVGDFATGYRALGPFLTAEEAEARPEITSVSVKMTLPDGFDEFSTQPLTHVVLYNFPEPGWLAYGPFRDFEQAQATTGHTTGRPGIVVAFTRAKWPETTSILIVGNPVDGLAFYGPFDTTTDSEAIADHFNVETWWIADLEPIPGEISGDVSELSDSDLSDEEDDA